MAANDETRQESSRGHPSSSEKFESTLAKHWVAILGVTPQEESDFKRAGGTSVDLVELQLRLLREDSLLLDLSRLPDPITFSAVLETAQGRLGSWGPSAPREGAGQQQDAPANGAQIEQWIAEKIQPESCEYVVPIRINLPVGTSWRALDRSLVAVVNNHASLRTSIHSLGGDRGSEFVQRVHPPVKASGLISRPSRILEGDALRSFLRDESVMVPTTQARRKYLAVGLVENGELDSLLLILHHVAVDDHSLGLIVQNLGRALAGEPCIEEDKTLLEWSSPARDREEADEIWWKERLESVSTSIDLPLKTDIQSSASEEVVAFLDSSTMADIDAQIREHGTMRSAVAIGILRDVLFANGLAQGDSVAIGTPMSLRDDPDVLATAGMFLNTVPVVTGRTDHFAEVAQDLWETRVRRRMPYLDIVEAVSPVRSQGRSPWLDACIGIMEARETPSLPWELLFPGESPFPILLMTRWTPGGLAIRCQVQERFGGRSLASVILADFKRRMEMLAGDEAWSQRPDSVLVGAPCTSSGRTVMDLVSNQIAATPEREAIVADHGDEIVTYQDVGDLSDRIAASILAAGVEQGDRVILFFDHGSELPVATLGAMKAGCVATPVPADTPPGRLERLAELASSRILIATSDALADSGIAGFNGDCISYEAAMKLDASASRPPLVSQESAAYLLFTSGSTGDPKPVLMPHRALANLVAYEVNRSPLLGVGRCAQFQAVGFDSSLLEFFATWARGEALYPVPSHLRNDPIELIDFIERNRVSRIHLPPLMARAMAGSGRAIPNSIEEIICTGEALRIDESLRSAGKTSGFNLVNQYGPTETHVVTSLDLGSNPEFWPEIPDIGGPIDGVSIRIEDEDGRVVEQGRSGEIVIEGVMVGLGYLNGDGGGFENRNGVARYRTGDVGRVLPNGRVEFLGRSDDQVKILGFRVEPAEVEAAIAEMPGVLDSAVVAVREAGDTRLHAFIEGHDLERSDAMRKRLERVLPRWLIPSDFTALTELPKTSSGKVNRRELQRIAISTDRAEVVDGDVFEDDGIAELCRLLPDLASFKLQHDRSFLDAGIDSLAAIRVQSALERDHGVRMMVRAILLATPAVILEAVQAVEFDSTGIDLESVKTTRRDSPDVEGWTPLEPVVRDVIATDALSPVGVFHLAWRISDPRPLDTENLRERLSALRLRFPSLRSRWSATRGTRVVPSDECGDFDLTVYADRPNQEVQEQFLNQRIELEFVDPIRVIAWPRAGGGHELLVMIHHVAVDGVLAGEMFSELLDPAQAGMAAVGASVAPVLPRDSDQADLRWWISNLNEQLGADGLPMQELRAGDDASQSYAADEDVSLKSSMEQFEVDFAYSRVTFGLAAWSLILAHRLGRDRVVIGVPFAMDSKEGLSANMLPIVAEVTGRRIGDLLDSISKQIGEAVEHRRTSLGAIITAMSGDKRHLRPPVDAVLTVDDLVRKLNNGVTISWEPTQFSSFQASAVIPQSSAMFGIEAEAGFLGGEPVESMLERWLYVMREIVRSSGSDRREALVESIDVLTPLMLAELDAFGRYEDASDEVESTLERFDRVLGNHLDDVAIFDGEDAITFGELDAWSRGIACRLMDQGVKPGDPVAVAAARGLASVASLLGVLRAGGWFVPIEPEVPEVRKVRQIETAGCVVGLQVAGTDCLPVSELEGVIDPESCRRDHSATLHEFPGDDPRIIGGDSPMYGMFTSGTTGEPRCVIVPHRAVNRLVDDPFYIRFDARSRMLNAAPLAFDASTIEIWGPLLNGGSVAVWTGHSADIMGIADFVESSGVNQCWLTSAIFNAVVDTLPSFFRNISTVITGGDVVSVDHVRRVMGAHPDLAVVNGYGPTENTVFTACNLAPAGQPPLKNVFSIGRPIRGTRVRVVDDKGRLVPKGRLGQLIVEGAGLASGYLGEGGTPEQRDGFRISDSSGLPEYHTGDYVRWLPFGDLEFSGREDHQVKISGHRVELDSVEHALRSQQGILDACACVLRNDGRASLGAVVVPERLDSFDAAAVLAGMGKSIFSWEIPSSIVAVDRIPITSNGKPDRVIIIDLLKSPEGVVHRPRVLDSVGLVDVVKRVVSEMMAPREVDPARPLREQGLDSLDMLRLTIELEKSIGRPVQFTDVLANSSVSTIAQRLAEDLHRESDPILVLRPGSSSCRTAVFCIPGVGGTVFSFERFADSMPSWCPVYGLPYPGISGVRRPQSRVETLADTLLASSLERMPTDPVLLGYSFGGFVAFEVARKLVGRGFRPTVVAIDSAPVSLSLYKGGAGSIRNWKLKLESVLPAAIVSRLGMKKSFAVKHLRSVVAASFEAIRHYDPKPFDVPVHLLRTTETDFTPFHEIRDLGWEALSQSVTVDSLRGHHLDVFRVAPMELARKVREITSGGRRDR